MKFLKREKLLPLVLACALIFLTGCSGKKNTSSATKSGKTVPQEESLQIKQAVYSFKVEGYDKDKKVKWGLEGESANVIDDKININNLKAVYKGDETGITLFADRAVYDRESQGVELKENIVGKTSDGTEFVTDYALWDPKKEEITTDSYVIVRRENVIARGKGLAAKPMLKWVSFNNEVDVDFGEEKKITCAGPFEIDHAQNIAIFRNDVKITDKDGDMYADKLTVYLDAKTNEVERVVTEGNVKIVHKGDIENIGNLGKVSF